MPNTAVRLFFESAEPRVQFVKSGQCSDALSLDQAVERSIGALVLEYIELGFTHIIPRGLDHIIFILGLTLISKRLIDLVIQVTAFTVAHSVTWLLACTASWSFHHPSSSLLLLHQLFTSLSKISGITRSIDLERLLCSPLAYFTGWVLQVC